MKIHMTFKQMDATEPLKSHAKDRTEKLEKFTWGAAEATWVFFLEADKHVADLRVTGMSGEPKFDFFAQAKTQNLYQSIDEAAHRMEKQLRKHKEMVKDHLHRNNRPTGE